MRLESIITLEGLSVGGEESRIPKEEKQRADRVIVTPKIQG